MEQIFRLFAEIFGCCQTERMGKMKRALVLMADGFEEIEAMTVVDILRRAQIEVTICSIYEHVEVIGAHGVRVIADKQLAKVDNIDSYDAVITPGGLPGSTNLRDDERVIEIIRDFFGKQDNWIACICASPIVLARAGIAGKIEGTCYPGCEAEVGFKRYREEPVVSDGNVVTSRGPATSVYFALELVRVLVGENVMQELKQGLMLAFAESYYR